MLTPKRRKAFAESLAADAETLRDRLSEYGRCLPVTDGDDWASGNSFGKAFALYQIMAAVLQQLRHEAGIPDPAITP